MATKISGLLDRIAGLSQEVRAKPSSMWGTVVALVPLTVTLDTDKDTPIPGVGTLVGVSVGDRVRLEQQGARLTITGVGAPTLQQWESTSTLWAETSLAFVSHGPLVIASGVLRREGGISNLGHTGFGRVPQKFLPAQILFGDAGFATPIISYSAGRYPLRKPDGVLRIQPTGSITVNVSEACDYLIVNTSWLSGQWFETFEGAQHALTRSGEGTYLREWNLSHGMVEGENLDVHHWKGARPSVAVLSIHGGVGEWGAQPLAEAFAEQTLASTYIYEALPPATYAMSHMSSNKFDDPRATGLVRRADRTFSFHGAANQEEDEGLLMTYVGGHDAGLRVAVINRLREAGFEARDAFLDESLHAIGGIQATNICNLGRYGGVQLELGNPMRRALFTDGNYSRANWGNRTAAFTDYVAALKRALTDVS